MDRLYAALCKYYKPMTMDEFEDMDAQELTNAILVSGMPKEVAATVWIERHGAFDVVMED